MLEGITILSVRFGRLSRREWLARSPRRRGGHPTEWTYDPAIMQTRALCYVGSQLGRIASALEALDSTDAKE
jgi:hypothetical protein